MFKAPNINDRNRRVQARRFSSSDFEFVSDFGFRASCFRRRRAYSFAEVLFAVVILGIGFIMIAAIFPVAIQQTQASSEETVGAAVTRACGEAISHSAYMNALSLPPTSPVGASSARMFCFNDPRITGGISAGQLWDSVKQDLISNQDSRFACVAMYSRIQDAPSAKLIVIGVRIRNDDQFKSRRPPPAASPFGPGDIDRRGAALPAELEPRPVKVVLTEGVDKPDTATISNITAGDDPLLGPLSTGCNAASAAVEGAYLIISDDRGAGGRSNGKIYRLADYDTTKGAWNLAVGEDMQIGIGPNGQYQAGAPDDTNEQLPPRAIGAAPPANQEAFAFLVGRGYADPSNPAEQGGTCQAVQKFVMFVPLP